MKLPNPSAIHMTQGVASMQGKGMDNPDNDYRFPLALAWKVREAFLKQPDVCTDGGNDKSFFSFEFRGEKLWAVANEVGGLTIMLPTEY